MTTGAFYMFAGIALFCLGCYALVVHAHLLRKILAFNVMGTGVSLLLVAMAYHPNTFDPVPQALVITGIVVLVCATALGLVLTCVIWEKLGRVDLSEKDGEA